MSEPELPRINSLELQIILTTNKGESFDHLSSNQSIEICDSWRYNNQSSAHFADLFHYGY